MSYCTRVRSAVFFFVCGKKSTSEKDRKHILRRQLYLKIPPFRTATDTALSQVLPLIPCKRLDLLTLVCFIAVSFSQVHEGARITLAKTNKWL